MYESTSTFFPHRFVLKVEDIELQRNSLEACGLLSAWEGLAAGAEASAPAAPAAAAAAGEEPLPAAGAEEGSSSRKEGSSGDSKLVVRMMESHGDCVTQLPPGALLLASSGGRAVGSGLEGGRPPLLQD